MQGVGGDGPVPWTIMRGADLPGQPGPASLLVNESAARTIGVEPGDTLEVRASCTAEGESLPPVRFRVAGVADFPFDDGEAPQAATTADSLAHACGEERSGAANMILVTSAGDADAAASAITALDPGLAALTNDEAVGRMEEGGFTLLPPDLHGVDDGDAGVRAAAHHRAADRVREPAPRGDRGLARPRLLARAASSPTCCASQP